MFPYPLPNSPLGVPYPLPNSPFGRPLSKKCTALLRMCIFFCNFARYFEMNEQFYMINLINLRKNMAATQQNSGASYNSLTIGSKIIGSIITDSNIRVDGTIEGDVKCAGKLVVGEKGVIIGTIECENAEIMGTLDGKIQVKQSLALFFNDTATTEIYSQTLTVEPNAIFNGTCAMGNPTK